MSLELLMRRRLNALHPINSTDLEAFGRISPDELLKVVVTRPRNGLHHRKFFALINAIFEHQTVYATKNDVADAIKIGCGYFETLNTPRGEIVRPKSISFTAMDQATFEEFYDKALTYILDHVVPGVGRDDLQNEIDEILAGR